MRKIAVLCLPALLASCSSLHRWPAYVGPGATLTARVVASREVTFFIGDVAMVGPAYVVEPANAPGSRLMVFVDSEDCQAARNDGRTYRMRLGRGRIMYGLTANPEDRRWMPSLVISSCVAVGGFSQRGNERMPG